MEHTNDTEQLRQYLAEAVEMLDDVKPKLALFEKQRYFRLKAAVDSYIQANKAAKAAPKQIELIPGA
ncbi:hypothetical protein [Mucilaginibacter psychrotolerans]|uniref:Uncharacterized protein n=1 Tax=Mucilaginibacter psychrotolerans TaxID=1524096 RepID=A0A4Y8SJN4_9SPHI|nr:hypothetical protein [Mucilaginibacter psychrotolerans]TFF39263.1 hypothetical protein E2R66_06490 [Mucilaginibacter psychrotolerans]